MPKVFISHASQKDVEAKKIAQYLTKNGSEVWIDDEKIRAGDSINIKISEGIKWCTHLLLLWSSEANESKMVNEEWNAAFKEKIIILGLLDNMKPPSLLSGKRYLDFRNFDDAIRELIQVLQNSSIDDDQETFRIKVASVRSGKVYNLTVQQNAIVDFLIEEAQKAFDLEKDLPTGGYITFPIRWVLVHSDAQAKQVWYNLSRLEKQEVSVLIYSKEGPKLSKNGMDKLKDIGVYDGIIFNLHYVEDVHKMAISKFPDSFPAGEYAMRDVNMVTNDRLPPNLKN